MLIEFTNTTMIVVNLQSIDIMLSQYELLLYIAYTIQLLTENYILFDITIYKSTKASVMAYE